MNKRKKIIEAIRIVWDSLDSHLDDSIEPTEKKKCCQKAVGSPSFHRKCIKEYVTVIATLAGLL